MKVVIGGCGRVGAMLATKLSFEGHDVVIIDKSVQAFRRLGRSFSGDTVRGMVFDKGVLDLSGIDRADAYVAVTSGDNSNVVSATIARDIYRVPKVVARIFDPRRAEIYRRLGIQTVSSVTWAANEITALVLHQHLVRDVSLGDGEVQVVRISIPPRLVNPKCSASRQTSWNRTPAGLFRAFSISPRRPTTMNFRFRPKYSLGMKSAM